MPVANTTWSSDKAADIRLGCHQDCYSSGKGTFDGFSDDERVTCTQSFEMSDWSAFGLFGKYRMRQFQRCLQNGKRRSGWHSNTVSRQQMCQNRHHKVRKAFGNLGRGSGRWGRKASDEV
jgi:hypothetical protein